MANGSGKNLARCLFALEKQHEKRFEVIVVGEKKSNKHKKLLNSINVAYLQLADDVACYNAHRLVVPLAQGTFILYLDASDLPHPALLRELLALWATPGDLPAASATIHGALPSAQHYAWGGHRPVFAEKSALPEVIACGNDALFGKLYLAEKWKAVIKHDIPDALAIWMPFLDALRCVGECENILLTNDVLLKREGYCFSPAWRHALTFAAGLKVSFPAMQQWLRLMLPEPRADSVLEHLCFSVVPSTLCRLLRKRLSTLCLAVIYSHTAFYLDHCRALFPERMDELTSVTFAGLAFGRFMSSKKVHSVHAWFIQCEKYRPQGILVYENENLHDLKSSLVPTLRRHYPVTYVSKAKFCEYNQLEHMLHAILASRSLLILASFWMHDYGRFGRRLIQLWHGNGLMKKILMPTHDRFHQDFAIASSEACRDEYARIFAVPREHILVYGTIQTDKYFDASAVAKASAAARAEAADLPENTRLCFFAPTHRQFRQEDVAHYFCKWDYEGADSLLESGRTAIVYKKHPILRGLQRMKGISQCDLFDSPGRRIRETLLPDPFDWICACDVFMTDYSSAMFYPLLLNKPLVFYAPDLDEFLSDGNGTLIDYVHEVPGPVITEPSLQNILEAMDEAPSWVGTEKYQKFKKHHMGACDGQALRRLINFIDPLYAREATRLGGRLAD